MRYVLILLVAGCATAPEPRADRCVGGLHEEYVDGRWEPKIDCLGKQLSCHRSEVTEGYRPLRWASDSCSKTRPRKLYLE